MPYLFTFLLMTSVLNTSIQSQDPLIIAHRGVPYFAPEETLPSYLLAKELGADYLEADLQRTKDGVIIAVHDNDLRRTTNIAEVYPGRSRDPVSSFTWQELQSLDAGSWFNQRYPERARKSFKGLKLITLDQLLDIAASGDPLVGVYLETKHPELFPGIEKDLFDLLKKRGWLNKRLANGKSAVYLQTFSPESLELLNQHFPHQPKCWLMWKGDACLSEVDEEHFSRCLKFARQHGAETIGPSFNGDQNNYFNLMEPWMVTMAREEGFEIHPYTFATENDINRYGGLSNGLFTDRSDLVNNYLNRDYLNVEEIFRRLGY